MMLMRVFCCGLGLAFCVAFVPCAALAQSAQPNKTETITPPAPANPAQKPKKPRSAAQKKNDERMKACGQEWRIAKASQKTGGKNWREFSRDCRRQKKAGG
jgi:hypothetical protein